ncbi:hypothetical protein KHA93_19315 [Bacillus sp. FJAT-49732]|uniref:Uncharacterized protein n=1 Tax=Lederbergia citrisecunda TaxID=2833583 RepID=A0A942YPY8_9BACI|nr:hypothetical protein [Lederbergia citrisecunda]MBS4201756.1 hypothetical protein [Lederbergia citrisecunda]
MQLSITGKRWLLTIHLIFSAIMLGNMVTFLILSITAAGTGSEQLVGSCYQIMHVLSKTSVRASTIGTLVSGILLSIWTKWGLFKFYWIIVKEILTALLLFLNLWGMYAWTMNTLAGFESNMNQLDMYMFHIDLWTGIVIQILSLLFIFVISVFKPWGMRKATK